jgi:hypothetical protein
LVSRPLLAALAVLPVLGACAPGVSTDADCNARIRYEGVLYRPHNALNESAPQGAELGTGDVVGCGEAASAPKVDEVTVYAVRDVPHSVAIKTRGGGWDGIFVAEGVPRSEWPTVLRRR